MNYNVFISHASEDKDAIARPLADELRRHGFDVWFDEYVLKLGDSLHREIDKGLASCQFGIVILSKNFFAKEWPRKELDGLVVREASGKKIILPVWHNIDRDEVARYSLTLADRFAVATSEGLSVVVGKILHALNPTPSYEIGNNQINHCGIFIDHENFLQQLLSLSAQWRSPEYVDDKVKWFTNKVERLLEEIKKRTITLEYKVAVAEQRKTAEPFFRAYYESGFELKLVGNSFN